MHKDTPNFRSWGTPISKPNFKSDCKIMTLISSPDSKIRVTHRDADKNSEWLSKMRLLNQNESAIYSDDDVHGSS